MDPNAPPQDDSPRPPGALPEGEEYDLHQPEPPRRVWLPIILFVLTCISTFWAGAVGLQGADAYGGTDVFFYLLAGASWQNGLTYMLAVMGILLAHEMGHFVMTRRHHIPASFPFFIPMPLPPIGTMGAVIAMQGSKADRKELFDIGIAGPLAGLVIAIPVLCIGIYIDEPGPSILNAPLIAKLLVPLIGPELEVGQTLSMGLDQHGRVQNPLLLAGWVGLLITGLNMLPISQLDGGHVAYALFRRRAHYVAHALLFLAIVFVVASEQTPWVLMLALVVLIGVNHPPTANDNARLGRGRIALGCASLIIPILCFPPQPFNFDHAAFASLVGLIGG